MKQKKPAVEFVRLSTWQAILSQSRLYGGQPIIDTRQEAGTVFKWPESTWLSRRLEMVRQQKK